MAILKFLRRLAAAAIAGYLLLTVISWYVDPQRWGPFRGRMVDAESRAPIAGAHVVVSWDRQLPTPTGDGGRSFFDAHETMTDGDGYFELPGPSGWWRAYVTQPDFQFFAPAYVWDRHEVTPPDGKFLVDPTVIGMRPLKTREEQCGRRPGTPLHDKAPLFRDAVLKYRLGLDC